MVVLLILPQVDPLDTAFQQNTAPIVVHARATRAPIYRASDDAVKKLGVATTVPLPENESEYSPKLNQTTLSILLQTLRC